jgi:hypothetical protein
MESTHRERDPSLDWTSKARSLSSRLIEMPPSLMAIYVTGQTLGELSLTCGRALSDRLSSTLKEPGTFIYLKATRKSRLEFLEKDPVVKVAILDTGIDPLHRNVGTSKNFCDGDDRDVQDLDGHGTQVASIVLQLAPNAQLCIARILDGDVDYGLTRSKMQVGAERSHILRPRPEIVAEVCNQMDETMRTPD